MDGFEFVETRRAVRREDGDHAGREAAVGDDVDSGVARLRIEREFRGDDGVVAAEVAEVRARLNRGACELQIVKVGTQLMTASCPRMRATVCA